MNSKLDMDAITDALAHDYADSLANDPKFRLEAGYTLFRQMSDDLKIQAARDAFPAEKLEDLGINPRSPATRQPADPQALYALVRRTRDEIKAAGGIPGGEEFAEEIDAVIKGIEADCPTEADVSTDVLKPHVRQMYDVLSSALDEMEASGGFLGDDDLFDTIAATLRQTAPPSATAKRRRAGPQ